VETAEHRQEALTQGTRLRLDIPASPRSAIAHIVRSDPLGPPVQQWYVALELDQAGDVWNVPWRARDWGITG